MQKRSPDIIDFCDLSCDLDAQLRFIADLAQANNSYRIIFDDCLSEFGNNVIEYLSKRVILEHVFFGRALKLIQLDNNRIKAELWRFQKIRASCVLKKNHQKKTNKRSKNPVSRRESQNRI